MPDQQPIQGNPSQQAPIVAPDLSVGTGLIEDRPYQAPLPQQNTPLFSDPQTGAGGGPRTIAEFFNAVKTPADTKRYLNPEYTPQPLTKRYDTWNPIIDNEQKAAENQSSFARFGNGLVKFGATALGTFAEGLMTIPDTIQAINDGKLSSDYQSDFEKNTDQWLKNLEDEFPNYYSQWEQKHPFLSSLPFSGGFANFWSDKVIKNLGFTVGAIGGALTQDLVVGAVTDGIGEIPLIGRQIGKAALWFNKIFSTETKLGEFLGATKPGLLTQLMDTAGAVPASKQTLFDLKELAQVAATKKITDATRYALNLYGAARTEAGFEARDGYNTVKQDLIDQFRNQHNREPNDQEIADIERYATAGANVRFGANLALLTLSDAIQFDNVLKPFSSAKKGITGTLQRNLGKATIGLKEGTVDTFERKLPTTFRGKVWNAIKPTIPNILAEGVYEEGGQYAAQVATQNYYERKYYADQGDVTKGTDKTKWSPATVENVLHSTMAGLSGEFGSTEGWENIILGGLTAVITGGVEHLYDKIKGHSDHEVNTILSLLNNNSVTGLLSNMFGNAMKSGSILSNMQQAVRDNDLFRYKNEQSHLFTNFVLAHLQADRFDVALEKLNIARDLPQGEFERAFGIDKSDSAKKTVGDYIDGLVQRAEQIKNNFEAINQVFQNPYSLNRKPKNKAEALETEKYQKFEEWKASLLQHTSDIDDSNRRLKSIAETVTKINPLLTPKMIQDLTHPRDLEATMKIYEKEADDLEKQKKEGIGVPERDNKQITILRANAKLISEFLNAKPEERDEKFAEMFEDVLNFKIQGEDVNNPEVEGVKKQNIPTLANLGIDSNRIKARKEIAKKAYNILTSEKGFNKYFANIEKLQNSSVKFAKDYLAKKAIVNPDNFVIPVVTKGGEEMRLKEGQSYVVNTSPTEGQIEAQQLKYEGTDEKGDLHFTDANKQPVILSPSEIAPLEKQVKAAENSFKSVSKEVGTGAPISEEAPSEEEDKKKDVSFGPISTTDPRYNDTSDFQNHHRRHQEFLFNLGSTDPKVFDQSVKSRLFIYPVTENTAKVLGFPEEFTKKIAGEEETIRGVYISTVDNEPVLLDKNGKVVQKLDGSPVDPNRIIFTSLPSTSLKFGNQDRYTNKQGLDEEKVKEWHKSFRENLLSKDKDNMPIFKFSVSRGMPNIINTGSRNLVTEVGLVREEDLHKLVITIPTVGDTTIAAILNDEGEGIASATTGVNMPAGIPLLNHGGNLIFLNNRQLTEREVSNVYDLLLELARRAEQNKRGEEVLDKDILKYLSRILYFSSPIEGKAVSPNQIWIDKDGLHLGPDFSTPFFTNSIQGRQKSIKEKLSSFFHNVNNYELNRVNSEKTGLEFNELQVNNHELEIAKTWPSYQHYLLTSNNAPLTTNIAKPQGDEILIVQKYSVLQVSNFNPKAFESDKPLPKPSKPAVKGAVTKAAPLTEKVIFDVRHSMTNSEDLVSGVDSNPLTPEGIQKAKELGKEAKEKGAVQIIAGSVTRHQQTANEAAAIANIPVTTFEALNPWDVGEWTHQTEEDFKRAEEFFAKNPDATEFEGKKINQTFRNFVSTFLAGRLQIEKEEPANTMVVTSSKNLKIWEAYKENGNKWDKNAVSIYLREETPENAEVTPEDKSEGEKNELVMEYPLVSGKKVKYAQIFDGDELVGIRIIAGVRADGSEVKLPENVAVDAHTAISQALGLVTETPQTTTPIPSSEVKKASEEVKALKPETSKVIQAITDAQKQVQGRTEDQQFYIINGENYRRVTSVIPNDFDGDTTKYENARIAGSQVDALVRDFFAGKEIVNDNYNMSKGALADIVKSLKDIKETIEKTGEKFITNNIVLFDTKSKIAGEVDILAVDKDGNFNIYDIKTAKDWSKFDTRFGDKLTKRENYTNQLSAYSNLLENQFGVKAKNLGILPIQISYDDKGKVLTAKKMKGISLEYDSDISEIIPLHEPEVKIESEPNPNASSISKLLGHKGKPKDSQYKAANIIPGSYEPTNLQEEFARAKSFLPDWVQFNEVQHLIHMTGGGKAWGALKDASIYVYKNAIKGVTYHEAFELVWQHFLEPGQQLSLYKEFQERQGFFNTYNGEYKTFSAATFKEAKEQIADEFMDYVQDGKLPVGQKQKTWFQKLVAFFKKIFLGNQGDINQLFKNITSGYYKNYPASQKNIDSIAYRNIKASEAFIQDVLQGMTADLFSREFEKDSAIVTQLEENPKQATASVYGRLFNSMQYFFTNDNPDANDTLQAIYADKAEPYIQAQDWDALAIIDQEFRGVQSQWEFIKNNWSEFVKEHQKYLRVFKVEFTVDDQGDIKMDSTSRRNLEDFETMSGQSEYARDIMLINARNAASEKVKLLFATIADREFIKSSIGETVATLKATEGQKTRIKRENSQVRMPKLAPYAKFFNYVLHNVSNINGIYDIYKKLVAMSNNPRIRTNANVDALVNRLNFKQGFKISSIDQAKMILSVENALSKQKPDFVRQFVDADRNVYFRTSIVNSKVDQVTEDWITQVKASDTVKTTSDGNFIFNKSVKEIKDPLEFLNKIGIGIEKDDYSNLSPKDKTDFNNEVNALKKVLEDNVGKKLPIFTTKQLGIDSRLNKLASIYVDKVIGDDTDSMHFNLDGELTANFVLGNYASTILNDANNSKTRDEFLAKNPQYNDIFHRDSILLNEIIYGEDGKFISPINIAVAEGREGTEGEGRAASALTKAERFVYEINNNLQGVFYTLLPADAKTEWAIYSGTYIKASEYFDKTTTLSAQKKFFDRMWSNLQTEVALAKDFSTNANRQNITELNKNYLGRKKGSSLRFFSDILDKDTVDRIHHLTVDQDFDLENAISREDFDKKMDAWITQKAKNAVNYLASEKIFGVSDKGNYRLNGILTEFISKNLEKAKYHTPEETIDLLKFREMNYAISGIEMHKFFFGDPAQYSDEMKRIKSFLSGREWSHVDYVGTAEGFNQFANSELNRVGDITLTPQDPGYHNFKNHLNTITTYDIIADSTSPSLLQKVLGEEAIAYENMNEADAQTWQTITSYRESLLKAGGRWSQAMEDQFQWEMAYERQARSKDGSYKYSSMELERRDLATLKKEPNENVFFYITKPVHSGIQAVGETAIMSLDKTSSAPLFYRMSEGRGLVGLYTAMQKKGTDYVRVESAHKVGIQNKSITSFYNEEGYVNTEGIAKATHEEIPFKYYGIQVDTSNKKESQTEGSQLRKQAIGDLMENRVPIDFKGNNWESLTEKQKEEASPIYRLVNQHDQALSALTNKRYQNLLSKLGMRETEEGFEYDSLKKVSDFILNEITRRELPTNLSDAVEVDPENPNQFRIPLEALSNYQQVRNILWSTVEKTVIRPKVSGGMKIQLAATGWEKGPRIVKQTVNGKTVYTSSELKFYSVGEDGKTQACEIMLPYWFGSNIRKGLEERGKTFSSDKDFKDHIVEYLNKSQEGRKLLSGIGFRIPTQRDNSIEMFVVKDFLPEQMGDVIVLPSEITTKAGSDFDVDKLNVYLRNFYIGKKGYPKAVPFENIDTNDPEQLKWYYEKYMLEANRKYEQWFREKSSRDFVNKVFQVEDEDQEPEYVPSLEEFILQSQGKSAWEMNSIEALENKYFDILQDIYSLPEKLKGLLSPNDASGLKAVAEKINRLKNPEYSETKQPYGRVLDSLWMMSERHKYLVGKKGVGIAAVAQTNLNVNQTAGVHLVTSFQPRLPYNTVDVNGQKFISLGAIKNQSGEEISKINASFIDGYVDIAKGAWIIDMGATDETAKDFLLQVKWGTDKYDVALFMNQPAIQMYINERSSRKSVSQINEDVRVLGKRRLFELVGSRFKAGLNKTLLDKRKPKSYSRADMENMIAKYGRGEAFTKDEAILQMQMLSDYQEIDSLGWDMFRFVQGYNWDTSRNNDPNLVYKKNLQYEAALNSPIRDLDKLMKTSFIGAVRESVLKIDHALRSIFSTQVGESRETLNAIANDLAERRGVSQEEFRKAMLKAELSLLDYTVQTTTSVGGRPMSQWITSLITGNNAVAFYIDAIKKSGDLNLTTNPFIANIRPNIDKREGYPSTVELVEKDHDTYTSNVLTDAMRELNDNHTVIAIDDNTANNLTVSQIYKRLVLMSLLQSGSKRSSISFTHLIPNEHLSALIKDSVRNIKSDMRNFYDNNVIYRTNWNDETLVPTVDPTFYEDPGDPTQGQYVYEGYNSAKFNEILKQRGVQNPPKVLRLDPFQWGDKKVVRTVQYKRDPKTKQVIDRVVRIFKRIDAGDQPVIFSRKEFTEDGQRERTFAYAAFKEINKWGDGSRVQEYHDNQVASVLSINPPIEEIDDELVVYGALGTGFTTNLDATVIGDISFKYKNVIQAEEQPPQEAESSTSQPTIPVTTKKEIKFEEVNVDETKRAGKKDIFPISTNEGEVGEVEGYKVSFKSHPDLNTYVYKTEYGTWIFTDARSGKEIGSGDTIKEAVKDGLEKINRAIKGGLNPDLLKALGISRSEEEDVLKDKDNGCKK